MSNPKKDVSFENIGHITRLYKEFIQQENQQHKYIYLCIDENE